MDMDRGDGPPKILPLTNTQEFIPFNGLTISHIRQIAGRAVFPPPDSNHALNPFSTGHAFLRRIQTDKLLVYLATLPNTTPLRFEEVLTGITFEPVDRANPSSVRLSTQNQINTFIESHLHDLSFIVKRLKLEVPVTDLVIELPQWYHQLMRYKNAPPHRKAEDLESMVVDMGWPVAMAAMITDPGMTIPKIIETLGEIENDLGPYITNQKFPKSGWFTSKPIQDRLNKQVSGLKKSPRFSLDHEVMENYSSLIDFFYHVARSHHCATVPFESLQSPAEVSITGNIIALLPSDQEYHLREQVLEGIEKRTLAQNLEKTRFPKYFPRFITVYPEIKMVNFDPQPVLNLKPISLTNLEGK